MYFTINLAFSNYLELIPNMTDQLTINKGKTDFEQPLPVFLNNSHLDNSLSARPSKLKEFVQNYVQSTNNKEIFDLQKNILDIHFHLTKISFLTKLQISLHLHLP